MSKDIDLPQDIFSAQNEQKSTRDGFGEAVLELGQKFQNVVVLTADLKESTRVAAFAKAYPERFIEMGVSEQNMAGVAAGLSFEGKIPFMTSYGVFSPGRNWEQIRISICYSNANVKIASSHNGFSADKDGATHQALEDIALTRVLPNLTIINPMDFEQAKKAVFEAASINGPVYIRLQKNKTPSLTTSKTAFSIGQGQLIKKGKDVTVISTGPITFEVIKAIKNLNVEHNIDAELINIHTIKPLDEELIISSVKKTKNLITVEEHQIACGFGSAICEILSEKLPTKTLRLGMKNVFSESGSYDDLLEKFELNSKGITKQIYNFLK